MATGTQGEFVAVVNDTDPKARKAYSLKISGNNISNPREEIGDVVDGILLVKVTRLCRVTNYKLLVELIRQELL